MPPVGFAVLSAYDGDFLALSRNIFENYFFSTYI